MSKAKSIGTMKIFCNWQYSVLDKFHSIAIHSQKLEKNFRVGQISVLHTVRLREILLCFELPCSFSRNVNCVTCHLYHLSSSYIGFVIDLLGSVKRGEKCLIWNLSKIIQCLSNHGRLRERNCWKQSSQIN